MGAGTTVIPGGGAGVRPRPTPAKGRPRYEGQSDVRGRGDAGGGTAGPREEPGAPAQQRRGEGSRAQSHGVRGDGQTSGGEGGRRGSHTTPRGPGTGSHGLRVWRAGEGPRAGGRLGTNMGRAAGPQSCPQVRSSPLGAERLNTMTREMGPSCRTVHVCSTSARGGGRRRALRARPALSCPGPAPRRPHAPPHRGSAGPRGPLGRNRSGSRARRAAGTCPGGCGRQARGRWWASGRREGGRRLSLGPSPASHLPSSSQPRPVALGPR